MNSTLAGRNASSEATHRERGGGGGGGGGGERERDMRSTHM